MFSCAHINTRSILNNFDSLQDHVSLHNYDVVGISETWLSDRIDEKAPRINNYTFVRQDRDTRGGGVGIYIRSNLKFRVLLRQCMDSIEHIWIVVNLADKQLVIGTIYRPPNSNDNDFFLNFEDVLTSISTTYDNIICFGDFNINFYNILSNKTIKLNDLIETFNFNQLINTPTRITKFSESLIDLLLYNGDNVVSSGTRDIQVSDHQLIFCDVLFQNRESVSHSFSFRS